MSEPLTLRTEGGDEQLDLAEFEARVRRGEVSPQSLVRHPAVTGDSFVPAAELAIFQGLHEPRRAYFARAFGLNRFPWMTSALILVNLAVYLLTTRAGPLDIDDMVRTGAKVGPLVTDLGQLWRLFTANFLHRDALHIGLNLFVLFNVGGALENTYRPLDYLWLLVFSGLATMTTSLIFADAVSLGASGMVFGCLGGVVVFGLKYRAILPSRYRKVMAEAAIPTVLGLLAIGLTSAGVDNWAHVGGLFAGMLCALFMQPRLLTRPPAWYSPVLRAAPSLSILLAVAMGEPLFGDGLPWMRVEHSDDFGISVPVPRGWRHGANPLGSLALYNGLPGLGRASFAAEAVQMPEGADADAQAAQFLEDRLVPQVLGPEVFRVTPKGTTEARLADRDAVRVQADIEETTGTTHLVAYFVPRGDIVYQLVFTWPAAYPRYAAVVEQMVAGIRLDEHAALRRARADVLLFPNAPEALGRLGEQLRRDGELFPAVEALKAAVRRQPSLLEARCELAQALLQAGELEAGCDAARGALLYGPEEPRALEVDARCALARGQPKLALERLTEAAAHRPGDARLKAAVQRLQSAVDAAQ